MSNTFDNLKTAFAGESQANRRYAIFAARADAEGCPQMARLFRAAAEAEAVHARNHLAAMKAIGSTPDNLKVAIEGESYEFQKMYPGFLKQAKAEGASDAEMSFGNANAVEEIHFGLFQKAHEAIVTGTRLEAGKYYVCQRCGNTVLGSVPDICPICGNPKSGFKLVD